MQADYQPGDGACQCLCAGDDYLSFAARELRVSLPTRPAQGDISPSAAIAEMRTPCSGIALCQGDVSIESISLMPLAPKIRIRR